jgi:hypothetical protein
VTDEPVVVFNPVPGLHEKELAPLAINITESPAHIVGELTLIVRPGTTVTVAMVVFEQPAKLVPVIV